MPYQCNVPLSDDGSVVSIAAASGVCREEKLDVAHGVTNLPLLLLWPSADRTARTTLYGFLYVKCVKCTRQNCLVMHHNQPPATPLTLCWSYCSVALYVHCPALIAMHHYLLVFTNQLLLLWPFADHKRFLIACWHMHIKSTFKLLYS